MRNERHNCGGILRKQTVTVTKNVDGLDYVFTVEGKQCISCSEEVISRNTLRGLETLPVEATRVDRRRMGTLFTLDVPIICASTAESVPDSVTVSPAENTGLVAYVQA